VTTPKKMGIMGGSNGGLLVGTVMTQRPDLFNAVVCQVPLLDMLRFNKLLAGASWMGEYGNPDEPAMREVLKKYSPYHNLDPAKEYPKAFIATSTMDDRVHPGHARKMVARMEEFKKPVLYYENTEGGHASGANIEQQVQRWAREYTYLSQRLMDSN
jgi:prolyl oligopeptidase